MREQHLLVHSVPHFTADSRIEYGSLVCPISVAGDVTINPVSDHVVYFTGEQPCTKAGQPITQIVHGECRQVMAGVEVRRSFSNKPREGYVDYFAKMDSYARLIESPVRSDNSDISARTFRPVETVAEESVFLYPETNSARAGISPLAAKFAGRIAIVGLGGTGSYILDLVAKTLVAEIHLFDGDFFHNHNAFRAPGAASLDQLRAKPYKVDHFANMYSAIRRGVVPHLVYLDEDNVAAAMGGFDFVFVAVDNGPTRKLVVEALLAARIPFIDVGMDIQLITEESTLIGTCRTTMVSPHRHDHVSSMLPMAPAAAEEIYRSNIQIADLNMLNATLAVIEWKKHCGFYQDLTRPLQLQYALNTSSLTRLEPPCA